LEKIDLKKQYKSFYNPPVGKMVEVNLPPLPYLMIDGAGSPASAAFADAMSALYSLAYTLKFSLKKTREIDFTVMGAEGLWWAEDMADYLSKNKDKWLWRLILLLPDFVTEADVEATRIDVKRKKGISAVEQVRLESFEEGLCVQTMYIGAYADEAPTIQALHQYIADHGYSLHGLHHEIYLGDPRRTPPERLKTILRQPMR
jgi:hypothetical protein